MLKTILLTELVGRRVNTSHNFSIKSCSLLAWKLTLYALIWSICNLELTASAKIYLVEAPEELIRGVESFPDNFTWGVGSSAFQIEGGFQEDGKGESIWDHFTHTHPELIADHSDANVSADSYHRWRDDVRMLKELGAKSYRFSLSWPRILPKGTTEVVNKAGLSYYNELIDELIAAGISPLVTLSHWDLPQRLQEAGGWLNHETVNLFGGYARLAFSTFGDRVKVWSTLNEPFTFCYFGYDRGIFPPADRSNPGVNPYACVHSQIMAHALAYRIYKEEFSGQGGKVGISLSSVWQEPEDGEKEEDQKAARQSHIFRFDWVAHPLFHGEYHPLMRKIIDERSKAEGRKESRLPKFDAFWSQKVKGSLDFLGLNHFTAQLAKFPKGNETLNTTTGWESDSGTIRSFDPNWPSTGSNWIKIYPVGIRKALKRVKEDYGDFPLIITENGVSDLEWEGKEDKMRMEYHRAYIREVLKAVREDGVRVEGYYAWGLLDGFEWNEGYTQKFGIVEVDFSSRNRTRRMKRSGYMLRKIFQENGLPRERRKWEKAWIEDPLEVLEGIWKEGKELVEKVGRKFEELVTK